MTYKSIVCGVTGSAKAQAEAARLAKENNTALAFVYVVDISFLKGITIGLRLEYAKKVLEHLWTATSWRMPRPWPARRGWSPSWSWPRARCWRCSKQTVAQDRADLLVVGDDGRTLFEKIIFGGEMGDHAAALERESGARVLVVGQGHGRPPAPGRPAAGRGRRDPPSLGATAGLAGLPAAQAGGGRHPGGTVCHAQRRRPLVGHCRGAVAGDRQSPKAGVHLRGNGPGEHAAGLRGRPLDLAVSAFNVTHEREQVMDFSHPFFHASLGVAVLNQGKDNWLARLWKVLTSRPMIMLAVILLIIALTGVVVWLVERTRNPEHFGDSPLKDMLSGLWWSAKSFATVGYGDKTVQTPAGRALGLFWMLVSLVLTAVFGAMVTSALTLTDLEGRVEGQQDLGSVRVGVVAHNTGEKFMARRQYNFARYPDLQQGLAGLFAGKISTPLSTTSPPCATWRSRTMMGGADGAPGFPARRRLRPGLLNKSHLREPVNVALLRTLRSER